ncbi:MAG: hypothetical protein ACRCZB_05215 [Bacteroidales bacterium]
MIPFIINENQLSMFVGGKPINLDSSSPIFGRVINALKGDVKENEIIDIIENFNKMQEKNLVFEGVPIDKALRSRLDFLVEHDLDLEGIKKFIRNSKRNKSCKSVSELYSFLASCNLPITDDGHFLAYKKVTKNFTDVYTNTIDNSIGSIVSIDRELCDPDSTVTCSSGLHVCSFAYLENYGGDIVLIVKVHPADVVAVPNDYENSKMRVCRYEVLDTVSIETGELITPLVVSSTKKFFDEDRVYL